MLERDSLWELQVFAQVVDAGSIAAASRVLRLTPSAVSKRLAHLEARLGARLVHRTTRSLTVTPEGAALRARAEAVFEALTAAEHVDGPEQPLRGLIRLTAPTLFGQEVIAPLVSSFLSAHPELQVELDVTDRFVDLVGESVDVAIRVAARLPPSSLVARKLVELDWSTVAAPSLLAKQPRLRGPDALTSLPCLESTNAAERGRWVFERAGHAREVPVRGPFVSSSLVAIRRAALDGLGVAQLPRWYVRDDLRAGRLRVALPGWKLRSRLVFAVQPSRALVPPRVRALVDHLALGLRRMAG
jgi:DNA-binding transcriptional LysR family regulator